MDEATTAAPDAAAPVEAVRSGCQHHWMIEPARASESRGRCTSCGAERVFSNAPVSRYDRDPVARQDRDYRTGARSSHRERIELSDER